MDAFEIADDLIVDPNLITAGERLIRFADAAMQEKNRKAPLNFLQSGMFSYFNHILDVFVKPKERRSYDFASGYSASGIYLATLLSSVWTSPVKTLNGIREIGGMLSGLYCEPVGEAISEEEIEAILNYLDSEYDAKKAILAEHDAIFLFPCSHREYNSECLALQNPETGKLRVKLLMYHMNGNGVEEGVDPRYVFCHELGHALHAKYINSAVVEVPDELFYALEVFYPSIRDLDKKTQNDILADVFAMGMMHGSPFADADPFRQIPSESKAVFRDIFRLVCMKTLRSERIKIGGSGHLRTCPE